MFRFLSIIVFAITVSGCAGGLAVSEPQDGDRARLRGIGGNFWVDQNICGDRPDLPNGIFLAMPSNYWHRSLNMPAGNALSGAWGEMYVRADQQIKISAIYLSGMGKCTIDVYFRPEKDKDYEAILSLKRNFDGCSLAIFDITNGRSGPLSLSREKLTCE